MVEYRRGVRINKSSHSSTFCSWSRRKVTRVRVNSSWVDAFFFVVVHRILLFYTHSNQRRMPRLFLSFFLVLLLSPSFFTLRARSFQTRLHFCRSYFHWSDGCSLSLFSRRIRAHIFLHVSDLTTGLHWMMGRTKKRPVSKWIRWACIIRRQLFLLFCKRRIWWRLKIRSSELILSRRRMTR